jgi:hypothetical protein
VYIRGSSADDPVEVVLVSTQTDRAVEIYRVSIHPRMHTTSVYLIAECSI